MNSWIRRWFLRQDDYTLWCVFIAWIITLISSAAWLITVILKGLIVS